MKIMLYQGIIRKQQIGTVLSVEGRNRLLCYFLSYK
jgi:hypothetical protein